MKIDKTYIFINFREIIGSSPLRNTRFTPQDVPTVPANYGFPHEFRTQGTCEDSLGFLNRGSYKKRDT